MKKILTTFLLLTIAFLFPINSYALGLDKQIIEKDSMLIKSSDFNEIKKAEGEMLSSLRNSYGSDLPADFPQKIDYSDSVKVYVDINIDDLQSAAKNNLLDVIKKSNYVWVIPITMGAERARITLSRGAPLNPDAERYLTEEDKEEIKSGEGKWLISEIAINLPIDSLKTRVDKISKDVKAINEDEQIYFIGGLPGLQQPIALTFNDNEPKSWIPMGYQYPILEDMASKDSSVLDKYNFTPVFEKVIEYSNNSDYSESGGGSLPGEENATIIVVVLFAALIIMTFSIVIYKRMHSKL